MRANDIMAAVARALYGLLRLPTRELYLGWRFMQNDIWAGVIPGVAFTAVALRHAPVERGASIQILLQSMCYFCLYLYGHTLANQIAGIEEDRINKPERPLPAGMVSPTGAVVRLAVVTVLFLVLGWQLGVLRWAALWAGTYLLLNFYGHVHWFFKNCLPMSVGATAMLCAAWEMAVPLTPAVWHAVLTIAGFVAITSPIQDFRDIAGDRVMGRKTLPIAWGERPARIVVSIGLIGWLPMAYMLHMRTALHTLQGGVVALAITALECIVTARLLCPPVVDRAAADHQTYRFYEYLYCLYVGSALVFVT